MSAKQCIWIINHYAALESKDGWAGRHQALASHLARQAWEPILYLASTGHPVGRQHLRGMTMRVSAEEDGVRHLMLRTPGYEGNGLGRMLNMAVFGLQLLLPWNRRGITAPSLVIGSTVHPLAAWSAYRLARTYKVPFVFEIRDVWPDALVHLGQLDEDSLPARAMRRLMSYLIRKADMVLSPLPGVADYVSALGVQGKPFLWVSNGAEAADLPAPRDREDRDEFVFMYLGSFGNAMAVEHLVSAFERVCEARPDLRLTFRLIGDGPKKSEFERQSAASSVADRIHFEPRIARKDVVSRAGEADCLVHSLHDHRVYDFGISPNKLFDYLLASRPIVFATNAQHNPISDSGAGRVVPAENVEAISDAMLAIVSMSQEERVALGRKGRTHLLEHYTYAALADKLSEGLSALTGEAIDNSNKVQQ
ncbi:glycosyltransferase family 4 protein [Microbacterium esteraromaticum]|uniref:Glycosyltransferase family 4 protein n=1 Tax=Microbacterium esteraromaticum TaxID=57043 RepID=A0A939DWL0_9MICO|nr:glycosyltransferase family 4 protein [Microbacterium esteraromaticum]MBN8205353.1 glycosyltransferase family 4 protein [Microbacterium esteraromaticum]MBN8415507.1 glycosyltransferase family 4 protein [Microbacterium esteraromaticum]